MAEGSTGSAVEAAGPTPGEGLPPRWYFTVGPTQLHPLVPGALRSALAEGLPSWGHRSEIFRSEVARTVEALRALLEIPEGHRVLFLGSATEAMERIAQGAVARRSFHLVNGAFARRFRDVAVNLGREVDALEVPDGEGFRLDEVTAPEAELIALTQNDTSTGVALDPEGIHSVAERHPGTMIAVDAVSAMPTQPLDLAVVDAAFFSVQKLFGLPAGLGVLIASPRLIDRARELQGRGLSVGGYLHLPTLAAQADRNQTGATPNALAIHLLGRVAEAYLEEGLEAVRARAGKSAARLRSAGAAAGWSPFQPRARDQSSTVLVFDVPGGSSAERARLAEAGFPVSSGYGEHKEAHVRIANFPVHRPDAVEALADLIEAG